MDYSLLCGYDEETKELIVGVIGKSNYNNLCTQPTLRILFVSNGTDPISLFSLVAVIFEQTQC